MLQLGRLKPYMLFSTRHTCHLRIFADKLVPRVPSYQFVYRQHKSFFAVLVDEGLIDSQVETLKVLQEVFGQGNIIYFDPVFGSYQHLHLQGESGSRAVIRAAVVRLDINLVNQICAEELSEFIAEAYLALGYLRGDIETQDVGFEDEVPFVGRESSEGRLLAEEDLVGVNHRLRGYLDGHDKLSNTRIVRLG